jgi:hypothetical protein
VLTVDELTHAKFFEAWAIISKDESTDTLPQLIESLRPLSAYEYLDLPLT